MPTTQFDNSSADAVPDSAAHQGRRRDLVTAALQTWSEHGYSQVSVRNVARRTRFSHGMVHYYFSSKQALVAECVRLLSQGCSLSSPELDDAASIEQLSVAFADQVSRSLTSDRQLHRIRYDLRNQSQFDRALRPYAEQLEAMWWGCVAEVRPRYEALGWQFDPAFEVLAAQLDGLLERAVRAESFEEPDADGELRTALLQTLPRGR